MIALYARISVIHAESDEETIDNQFKILRQYVKAQFQGESIREYQDVGCSGTTFERQGFMTMLADVQKGRIHMIVAKDLSRLGRNYLMLGWYLEQVFPRLGVRVVALGEEYDSEKQGAQELLIGLRNIMNEWYAKDVGRKVRMVKQLQKQEGNYLGSRAPYGYQIVKRDGRRVLQPDKAYPVRMLICNKREQGESSTEIAAWLSGQRIHTPNQYAQTGEVTAVLHAQSETISQSGQTENEYLPWKAYMVRGIWHDCYEHQRGLRLD